MFFHSPLFGAPFFFSFVFFSVLKFSFLIFHVFSFFEFFSSEMIPGVSDVPAFRPAFLSKHNFIPGVCNVPNSARM